MTLLAQAAADVLTSALNKKGLTPKSPTDLKTSLSAVLLAHIQSIFNAGEMLSDLQVPAFGVAALVKMPAKDFSALSAQQAYEKLKGVVTDCKKPAEATSALGPCGPSAR
jgi:hypothetical protein